MFKLLLDIRKNRTTLNNSKHRQAKEQTNGPKKEQRPPTSPTKKKQTHCILLASFQLCQKLLLALLLRQLTVNQFVGMLQTLERFIPNAEGPLWGCSPARQRDPGHLQGKANQLAAMFFAFLDPASTKSGNCAKALICAEVRMGHIENLRTWPARISEGKGLYKSTTTSISYLFFCSMALTCLDFGAHLSWQ